MAQLKQTCSVTNGSQVVTLAGDFTSRIKKSGIFMVEGELVPYTVAVDSTFATGTTTVTLTGAYAGATGSVAGVFVTDFTYPDMVPTIAQGDVGTAAVFTQAMYRLQDMIKAVAPDGLSQYATYYNEVMAAQTATAQYRDQAAASASTASTKAGEAAASASTASTKAGDASASATLAQDWAAKTTGTVDGTNYSAKYYAQQAQAGAQSDWAVADAASSAFIKNKPTIPSTTSQIAEGGNLYYTDARVRAATLAGLSTATNAAVVAADTVLVGIGKLQAQVSSKEGAIAAGTVAQYWRGDKTFQTLDKAAVGLGSVDNTSDANKPVSAATQAALDLKAPLASPALTGTPTAPTAAAGTNNTQIATTAYADAAANKVKTDLVNGAGTALDTLKELSTALGDDPNFATTVSTALGNRLRVDTAAQGLTAQQKTNAKTNIDLQNVDNTSDANKPVSTAQQTALNGKANTDGGNATGTWAISITGNAATATRTTELDAIVQTLHYGNVVAACIYDTSKDSDGGAWRKRCKHTSWENETLVPGKWQGQQANTTAAVAAGGVVGDYFQYTGDGDFYQITAVSPATATPGIRRGNKREFPAVAGIVVESGRVVIYDMAAPGCPMWMVFATVSGSSTGFIGNANVYSPITSVQAVNGRIYIGTSGTTNSAALNAVYLQGLRVADFTADSAWLQKAGEGYGTPAKSARSIAGLSARNGNLFASVSADNTSGNYFPNYAINSLATTVLPAAPVDPATGLQVPTIAVGTDGGTSIIKDDGTVVNGGENNASWSVRAVSFDKWNRLWGTAGDAAYGALQIMAEVPYSSVATIGSGNQGFPQIGAVSTVYGGNSAWPYLLGGQNAKSTLIGSRYYLSNAGVTALQFNPAFPQKSMVAYITNAYNTGWMVGDIRGAWLADIDPASGAELVANGTFDVDANWNKGTGWTISGGVATHSGAASYGYLSQSMPGVVAGKTYRLTITVTGTVTLAGGDFVSANTVLNAGTSTLLVTAVSSNLNIYANVAATVDNISVVQVETIVGTELVTNGTFTTDTSGWTASAGGGTCVASGGVVTVTNPAAGGVNQYMTQPIATVVGKTYLVVADVTGSSTFVSAGTAATSASNLGMSTQTAAGKAQFQFVATGTTTYLGFGINTSAASVSGTFDNVSCKLAVPDRSVKGKGLQVNGTLTKSAVAAGANLMAYSGFSAANYLEQPYNSDLDFGAGDFCFMGWMKLNGGTNSYLFDRANPSSGAARIYLYVTTTGFVNAAVGGGGVTSYSGGPADTSGYHHYALVRTGGLMSIYIDGVKVAAAAETTNIMVDASATLTVGMRYSKSEGAGALTLFKTSTTAPSADQIAKIYRDELALFQPGAQCTIDGNSTAVTALAYDDLTDLLHVGTSWGRSAFKGLQRVESSATSVGSVQSIAATAGLHVTAGAASARVTIPAITLREELRNRDEAKKAQAQIARPFWFTGNGTLKDFTLPYGWQPVDGEVTKQGMDMREGGTYDYTTSFDGYRWTVSFIDAPLNNHNICIKGTRNG